MKNWLFLLFLGVIRFLEAVGKVRQYAFIVEEKDSTIIGGVRLGPVVDDEKRRFAFSFFK